MWAEQEVARCGVVRFLSLVVPRGDCTGESRCNGGALLVVKS